MASSRYASSNSHLHQRDPRSALFGSYDSSSSNNASKTRNASPGYGYGVGGSGSALGLGERGNGYLQENSAGQNAFRPATPNRKGQYSDAVLNELESQNNGQVEGILGKVRMLKDMTTAIGDEIRSSTALTEKMNDSFDGARVRLRGTMNRMLVMAERTGVGWKVWMLFFMAVIAIFTWVWLF